MSIPRRYDPMAGHLKQKSVATLPWNSMQSRSTHFSSKSKCHRGLGLWNLSIAHLYFESLANEPHYVGQFFR